jgi:hypothetical protein
MKQDIYKNTQTLIVNNLVERFKVAFENTANLDLDQLDKLYASTVHFKDPIHDMHGIEQLKHYMVKLCADVELCRFEYLDEVVSNGKAYIKWNMYFSHPSLKKGVHKVPGVTQILFDSRIYFQEDIYDMGAMIYENVPVLGRLIKYLKQKLSK